MKIEIILILITIILLGFSTYLVYDSYFSEVENFRIKPDQNIFVNGSMLYNLAVVNDYPNGMLFYDLIRFPDKIINYSISRDCIGLREENIIIAFNDLQMETNLIFNRVNDNGQIEATCSEGDNEISAEHFIAGEGGPSLIINTSKYQVIEKGKILLFRDETCNSPIVATHEILHVLGFKHSSNKTSIMYNTSYCDQEITKNIKDKIYELYKDPSLPDLDFQKINVTKKGRYLNFEVEIINIGLKGSENVQLFLYADGEKISLYDLGNLEIGAGKLMKVENLNIPRSMTNIIFIIDENNSISEIDKKNNKRSLILQQ